MPRQHDQSKSKPHDPTVLIAAMVAELNTGHVGLTGGSCEASVSFSSYNEAKLPHLCGVDNGFVLRVPYAGTTVKFEMFFNLSDPLLTPDFVCLSDDDFCPDVEAEMPSLVRWSENRHSLPLTQQIISVVSELLTAFRRYQHSRLRYVYPNLRKECLGDIGDDVEVCLELLGSNYPGAPSARSPDASKSTWYLHALGKLPSLPPKTYQFVSNTHEAKDPIYLYWGISLPQNSTATGPCSSRPPNAHTEIALLRNETIRDFFNEFGFKMPTIDANDTFAVTLRKYTDAFDSFLVKTPQALERRRKVMDFFAERLQTVNIERRRYSNGTFLVTVGNHSSALLNVTFTSLQSSSVPAVELMSAYPTQRLPGSTRKTFPVKLSNMPHSFDQVKPAEFVEKVHTYLGHIAPAFISDVSKI